MPSDKTENASVIPVD